MKIIINLGWLYLRIRRVKDGEEEGISRLIEKANKKFKKDQKRKVKNYRK